MTRLYRLAVGKASSPDWFERNSWMLAIGHLVCWIFPFMVVLVAVADVEVAVAVVGVAVVVAVGVVEDVVGVVNQNQHQINHPVPHQLV